MTVEQRVWAALAEIQDPEMPISIVDLGLIYAVRETEGEVTVDLTFTAMGCPASDFILEDIEERLGAEAGVGSVKVNVVWDPPWSTQRLTEDGRDALEMWGLAV